MKFFLLILEGLADDPLEDLNGRTPLEVAKTPHLDLLAKKGKVGAVSFVPKMMNASPDVALGALLGFDPVQFYTGLAPLEVLARGVEATDDDIAFRANFVTMLDNVLFDSTSGRISDKEASLLFEDLAKRTKIEGLRWIQGKGYRHWAVIRDPENTGKLDAISSISPRSLLGQPYVKHLPKGSGVFAVADVVGQSIGILESHEINRVRIDLKENPANMVWLWGQGKKPRYPDFKQRFGLRAVMASEVDFAKGFAVALGMRHTDNFLGAASEEAVQIVYWGSQSFLDVQEDFRSKIRRIEEFDSSVVAQAVKEAERNRDCRIVVAADVVSSSARKGFFHGHVPVLIQGAGIEADASETFSEKSAAQSGWILDDGFNWMGEILRC